MNEIDPSTIRPLAGRLLVKREVAATVTPGGIAIPDVAQDKRQHGVVIATGPGKWNQAGTARLPLEAGVGDTVYFGKWFGAQILGLSEEYGILDESDILAVQQSNNLALRQPANDPKKTASPRNMHRER